MDGIASSVSIPKIARLWVLLIFLLACSLPQIPFPFPTDSSQQLTKRILVSLTEPREGEAYPVSAGLSVRGEAISDGSISRLELWADGALFDTYTAPEDGLGLLTHVWTWSPKTRGFHTLMVRAYNDREESAFSNVVHVRGVEDPGYILITTVRDGDTLLSIARRYGVTMNDLRIWNPSIADAARLLPGMEIYIQVGPRAGSFAPSLAAKSMTSLDERPRQAAPPAALAAPGLAVQRKGCTAALTLEDRSQGEKGFHIYRLDPGAAGFRKIASLPAHSGSEALTYQDVNLFGSYQYYAAAYDNAGEAAGSLAGLNITDPSCAGDPVTVDELAHIAMGTDRYYLYISINGGAWRRFPADEFTYLNQSDELDFAQVARALAPDLAADISMKGEVWGMVYGTASRLGTFEKTFKPKQAPARAGPFLVPQVLSTLLETRGPYSVSSKGYTWVKEGGMVYASLPFRFATDTAAAYGIWQVASLPFGAEVSFNPACLLLAGKTTGSGTPGAPHPFAIDFSPLKPKIEVVKLSPFENMLEQTPVFSPPFSPQKTGTSAQQTVMLPKWSPEAFGLGGAGNIFSFDPCAQNKSPEGKITYYVRLIPMSNGEAVGKPSNTVKLTYDPNGEIKITFPAPPPIPPWTYYDVEVVKFTGVHAPNYSYAYCVEIVENNNLFASFEPGDKLCPKSFKGGNEDGFLELVKSAVNFVSNLYNKLSNWATELVDKLNPMCIQAKLASSAIKIGEKEVKDACHYIAVAVVTAAKTYVGLPPSLPNYDQLVGLGKENLVELAAQELENNGVPCPEACKDVIRKGMDYTLEQAKLSMNNSSCLGEEEAHSHGFEPLCLPPGVISRPDPRGQPAPAVAEVRVTRRQGSVGPSHPEPDACRATINVSAVNDSQIGKSYSMDGGYSWKGEYIEGDLLTGSSAFPSLKPGQSAEFPIILKPVPYWVPGHYQAATLIRLKQGLPTHFDDWGILYEGSMATVKAGGTCEFVLPEGTGFSTAAVKGNTIQEGPLGKAWSEFCAPYNGCP